LALFNQPSIDVSTSDLPRVLISKISPPLYINSRKLAKETSTKVIKHFIVQVNTHFLEISYCYRAFSTSNPLIKICI